MWVYGLSDMGQVLFSSPVVGKVTSSTKRLDPSTVSGSSSGSGVEAYVGKEKYWTTELMGADGTYGSSDPYVFWFTPEGQYFQWNGKYICSSAPLKLSNPVLNMRDIDYQELQKGERAQQALKSGKKVSNNLEIEVNKQ